MTFSALLAAEKSYINCKNNALFARSQFDVSTVATSHRYEALLYFVVNSIEDKKPLLKLFAVLSITGEPMIHNK